MAVGLLRPSTFAPSARRARRWHSFGSAALLLLTAGGAVGCETSNDPSPRAVVRVGFEVNPDIGLLATAEDTRQFERFGLDYQSHGFADDESVLQSLVSGYVDFAVVSDISIALSRQTIDGLAVVAQIADESMRAVALISSDPDPRIGQVVRVGIPKGPRGEYYFDQLSLPQSADAFPGTVEELWTALRAGHTHAIVTTSISPHAIRSLESRFSVAPLPIRERPLLVTTDRLLSTNGDVVQRHISSLQSAARLLDEGDADLVSILRRHTKMPVGLLTSATHGRKFTLARSDSTRGSFEPMSSVDMPTLLRVAPIRASGLHSRSNTTSKEADNGRGWSKD